MVGKCYSSPLSLFDFLSSLTNNLCTKLADLKAKKKKLRDDKSLLEALKYRVNFVQFCSLPCTPSLTDISLLWSAHQAYFCRDNEPAIDLGIPICNASNGQSNVPVSSLELLNVPVKNLKDRIGPTGREKLLDSLHPYYRPPQNPEAKFSVSLVLATGEGGVDFSMTYSQNQLRISIPLPIESPFVKELRDVAGTPDMEILDHLNFDAKYLQDCQYSALISRIIQVWWSFSVLMVSVPTVLYRDQCLTQPLPPEVYSLSCLTPCYFVDLHLSQCSTFRSARKSVRLTLAAACYAQVFFKQEAPTQIPI